MGSETLTPEQRAHLSRKDFAVKPSKSNTGKEAYPIPDRQHAASALGFAKMHHDAADLAAVRKKIEAKYPDMLKKGGIDGYVFSSFAKEAANEAAKEEKSFSERYPNLMTFGKATGANVLMRGEPTLGLGALVKRQSEIERPGDAAMMKHLTDTAGVPVQRPLFAVQGGAHFSPGSHEKIYAPLGGPAEPHMQRKSKSKRKSKSNGKEKDSAMGFPSNPIPTNPNTSSGAGLMAPKPANVAPVGGM